MNIPLNMNDAELKKFIDKGEQFLYEPGELYNELIEAGYSKERIDYFISEKRKRESNSFKAIALFLSIIITCLGILAIMMWFTNGNIFNLLAGAFFCIGGFWIIKKAVKSGAV